MNVTGFQRFLGAVGMLTRVPPFAFDFDALLAAV